MWSVNDFRIRHQNICTDASQLPITAACTTQLWRALWCALMNKHLWLIGKCISRAPCCSPPSLLYYRVLATCPPSGAHFPLNRLRCEKLMPPLLHPLQQHSWLCNHFLYPLLPSVLFYFLVLTIQKIWLLEALKLLALWRYAFKAHFACSL